MEMLYGTPRPVISFPDVGNILVYGRPFMAGVRALLVPLVLR